MRKTVFRGTDIWAAECGCERKWLALTERQAAVLLAECPCRSER